MNSDLRRPSDHPRPPDEPPGDPPDRPPQIRDSYVDDPNDIFDTTANPTDRREAADSAQHGQFLTGEHDVDETEQATVHNETGSDRPPDPGDAPDNDPDEPFEFNPYRACLDDVTAEEAAAFIAANKGSIPWLAPAEGRHPQVQRVYAALETGRGHLTPRHDDLGDDEMYRRRVLYREDPAQLDDTKRAAGIDGCKPGGKPHFCGSEATRIHDPDAFATAFAHGIEHPAVRAKLDQVYHPKKIPLAVTVPITDLLAGDGHRACSGFQLRGDSPTQARIDRDAWLAGDRREGLEAPVAEPIPTFEGGHIEFRFRHNRTGDGYEVSTMFPRPPEEPAEEKESK